MADAYQGAAKEFGSVASDSSPQPHFRSRPQRTRPTTCVVTRPPRRPLRRVLRLVRSCPPPNIRGLDIAAGDMGGGGRGGGATDGGAADADGSRDVTSSNASSSDDARSARKRTQEPQNRHLPLK